MKRPPVPKFVGPARTPRAGTNARASSSGSTTRSAASTTSSAATSDARAASPAASKSALETVQLTSTRNGVGAIIGYRQDLAAGDLVVIGLTSYVGVTAIQWELLGRPSFSTAGGAGPEPINLGTGNTVSFNIDADVTGYKMDGSYKVQATLNPGSPGETRVVAVLARVSGIDDPAPWGAERIALRKPAAAEADDDTADALIDAGYAKQEN